MNNVQKPRTDQETKIMPSDGVNRMIKKTNDALQKPKERK